MDLVDGFRVFVASAATGSFSGAGTRLGISPKLASKYMAELEARLGTRLMQRTTRRLGLTAAGERLLAQLPDWLAQLDDMTGALREPQQGLSGVLRIAAPVTYGEMRILPLLRDFRSRHPDLVVDLRLEDRFVDLAAEGIDLAIRIGRLDNSALVARRLGQGRLTLVAAPAYLDQWGRPACVADLARHRCIRDTNMRGDGAWSLGEGKTVRSVPVSGPFLVNSATIARDLAVAGEGIAFCPDYVVEEALAQSRLEVILPHAECPVLEIHALYLRQRQIARRTRAFLDHLLGNLAGCRIDMPR